MKTLKKIKPFAFGNIYLSSQTLSNVYSVMQSDGNSFGGDVVWDTFNKISRDEDNILYKIYKANMFVFQLR